MGSAGVYYSADVGGVWCPFVGVQVSGGGVRTSVCSACIVEPVVPANIASLGSKKGFLEFSV